MSQPKDRHQQTGQQYHSVPRHNPMTDTNRLTTSTIQYHITAPRQTPNDGPQMLFNTTPQPQDRHQLMGHNCYSITRHNPDRHQQTEHQYHSVPRHNSKIDTNRLTCSIIQYHVTTPRQTPTDGHKLSADDS